MNDIDRLLIDYFDTGITDEDAGELCRRLEDADTRAYAARLFAIDRALESMRNASVLKERIVHSVLSGDVTSGTRERIGAAVMERVRVEEKKREHAGTAAPSRRTSVRWGTWAAVAAMLAIVAGSVMFNLRQAGRMPELIQAKLANLKGTQVIVIRAGAEIAAAADMDLRANDVIRTGAGSSVRIQFNGEATGIGLTADTEVTVVRGAGVKRLYLTEGSVGCSVAAQKGGAGLTIETKHATAEVRGTRFTLGTGADAAWVAVQEGSVLFSAVGAAFDRMVNAGERAIMGGGRFVLGSGNSVRVLSRFGLPDVKTFNYSLGAAFDGTSLWSADPGMGSLFKFTPEGTLLKTVKVGSSELNLTHLAWDGTKMWIRCGKENRKLLAVNPETGEILREMPLPFKPATVAYGDGSLWCAEGIGTTKAGYTNRFRIHEIDPDTGSIRNAFETPVQAFRLAWQDHALWSYQDGNFWRISPVDGRVQADLGMPEVHHGDLAPAGNGRFWIISNLNRSAMLVDTGMRMERYGP